MLISEIYVSRQGEGIFTGTPSVFVRTSGCNLRCGFCDTPFASWNPEGDPLTVSEIIEQVEMLADCGQHVVLTGGEPLLSNELPGLCQEIRRLGHPITIETAGTVFRDLDCDLMSVSPKLSNSDPEPSRAGRWLPRHQALRQQPQIVRQLISRYNYQLKFVVQSPDDINEILSYLNLIEPSQKHRVMLMPEGIEESELEKRRVWLEPLCEEHGMTYCPRRQIQWYGNKRGT